MANILERPDPWARLETCFERQQQLGNPWIPFLTRDGVPLHDKAIPYGMPAFEVLRKANGIAIRATGLTFIEGAEWRGFDDLGAPSFWNDAGDVTYVFQSARHGSGNVEYDGFKVASHSHDLFIVRHIAVPPTRGMRWRKAPTRSALPNLPLPIQVKLNQA